MRVPHPDSIPATTYTVGCEVQPLVAIEDILKVSICAYFEGTSSPCDCADVRVPSTYSPTPCTAASAQVPSTCRSDSEIHDRCPTAYLVVVSATSTATVVPCVKRRGASRPSARALARASFRRARLSSTAQLHPRAGITSLHFRDSGRRVSLSDKFKSLMVCPRCKEDTYIA